MRVLECFSLALPAVKVVRFARFSDHRGYFTESYRASDFPPLPGLPATHPSELGSDRLHAKSPFVQANESFSHASTVRGLHLQFEPHQGKLVRTVVGNMIDLAVDIRQGSPTFGKIIAFEMPASPAAKDDCWIWVPPGFAHGFVCLEDTLVQYLCTGEYNPKGEVSISPVAADLDWSLCDLQLAAKVQTIAQTTPYLSDKDRAGLSLADWAKDSRIAHFPASLAAD